MIRSCLSITLLIATFPVLTSLPRVGEAAETYHTCTGFIDSVPTTISTQGVWCLRKDVATSITSGAAIQIAANNVTIDCNNFKVGGLGAGTNTLTVGIANSSRLNTTVRNCNIRGFRSGITFTQADGAIVSNNRLEHNTEYGIYLGGRSTLVERNLVNDTGNGPTSINSIVGVYTSGETVVRDNIIQDVVASPGGNATAYGMWNVGGTGVNVLGNTVRNPVASGSASAHGIYTSNGQRVFISGNRVAAEGSTTGNGIRCNASNGSIKDNVSWGFSTPFSCLDDGGNVGR